MDAQFAAFGNNMKHKAQKESLGWSLLACFSCNCATWDKISFGPFGAEELAQVAGPAQGLQGPSGRSDQSTKDDQVRVLVPGPFVVQWKPMAHMGCTGLSLKGCAFGEAPLVLVAVWGRGGRGVWERMREMIMQ